MSKRPPIALLLVCSVCPQAAFGAAWMGQTIDLVPDVYNGGSSTSPADSAAAQQSFAKAQAAAEQGDSSQAFRLATEAVLADPDHAAARHALGYELIDGEWLTPYQAKMRARGHRWHASFGWLKEGEVSRYEAGERRHGRRWISAGADAARHAAIEDGWTVRTDHFSVTTNHSLEAGASLAAELEGLFQVWRQRFAGYWLTDREMQALLAGERSVRKKPRPMRVYYHRDKAGYVQHLKRRQPRIDQTLGIYFDDARQAHFYHSNDPANADQRRATLYHEATHQLFAENGPGRRGAGRDANFWLIEGVAGYFEMLAPVEGEPRYTFGNPAQGRLPSAVVTGPGLPMATLATLGRTDFQRQDNLPAVYAQTAGVVTMLMHGDNADPKALIGTLKAVYGSNPDSDELSRQAGRSYTELDQQYRAFLDEFRLAK